jgi:hypothetical protein
LVKVITPETVGGGGSEIKVVKSEALTTLLVLLLAVT